MRFLPVFPLFFLLGCQAPKCPYPQQEKAIILNVFPHNPDSFTQGLYTEKGRFYESSGWYVDSFLHSYTLGKSTQKKALLPGFFAEGLTLYQNQLYLLSWRKREAYSFNPQTLKKRQTFRLTTEGWGLTHNQDSLILSDGTLDKLYFLKPQDFSIKKELEVKEQELPVFNLNELEWIDGLIYANIWHTNDIVKISPKTGCVVARVDASELARNEKRTPGHVAHSEHVLNGIAYDQATKKLYLTGKKWKSIYQVKIIPR